MSRHKMISKPPDGEDEEEWLEDNHQQNGSSKEFMRFTKGGRVSRLSTLEKILVVLLILLTVALLAVVIAYIVKENKDDSTNNKASETCMSADCVAAAAAINSKIDYTVKPCDDFYQFACGNWMKMKVIPDDKSSISMFAELRSDVVVLLKTLLELPQSPSDPDYINQAKTLYASCLNYDLINKRGKTPLANFIQEEYGGWPLTTKSWDESAFDLTKMIITIHTHVISPLFAIYTSVDPKNSNQRVLMMDQTNFGMPSVKYYLVSRNDSMLMAYQTLIYKTAKIFGFADESTAEQEVRDIVDFEIELAKIAIPPEQSRDSNTLYNPTTFEEVKRNYSEILDWDRYMHTVMTLPGVNITDITDQEPMVNLFPKYFDNFTDVLKNASNRTIANYLVWRQVLSLINVQGDEFSDLNEDYRKALFGIQSKAPRFRTCVGYLTGTMGLAVGKLFIKDNFDPESKVAALTMIDGLHHAFSQLLDENDWMDEATKELAHEKSSVMVTNIGYPEQLTNDTFMELIYDNYSFKADTYFENVLVTLRERYKDYIGKLREPVNKNITLYKPSDVNAYFSPRINQITFPAGILQPPFFSRKFPKSLNYGGIGVVIGHEITHGFDDRGRLYDKYGNLVQWWTDTAEKNFKSKSKCIVDQYSNYRVDEINMNMNGITTQGENIADNGGLKQSYRAYRNWVDSQGKEEPALPGLDFTHDQLFYISFAQIWCTLMRPRDAISRIRSGVHSPGKFRVIGSAQNSEDFSRIFKCPATSKMNPKKKCSIW